MTQKWDHPLKSEKFTNSKHKHVGCLSRGALCLYFNLSKRILRKKTTGALQILYFEEKAKLGALGLIFQDTITQIKI